MARSKKQKIVHCPPLHSSYKAAGIMRSTLQRLPLALDEYEAIRLADYLGLDHAEAALEMEISRSTFSRLIEKSRKIIAQFLIEGKELYIEGGNIHFRDNVICCQNCGYMFKISIATSMTECPECNSKNLLSLAGGFGHGRCCVNNNQKKEAIMPRQDGTGPNGLGPGTGRRMGYAAERNGNPGGGRGLGRGGGRGRNDGGALGTGGFCVCAKCGEKVPHQQGVKCTTLKCPKCGNTLVRDELLTK